MRRPGWLLLGLALLLVTCGCTQEVVIVATSTPASLPTNTPIPAPPTAPTTPPTTAPASLPTNAPAPPPPATVTITVKDAPIGGQASASIGGPPNTQCTITYFTPAGTNSGAAGLVSKTTDASGNASWSWTIGTLTRPGTGHVDVTCGGAKASAPIKIRV